MKSLEKLREWLDYKINRFDAGNNAIVLNTGADPNALYEIADEIEHEIAERYMERPCDKNGEPTCVGQRIRHRGHEGEVWLLGVHEVMCSDRVCYPCGEYEHVKPRTLEDTIAEYVELSTSQDVKRHREVSDELWKIQREQFMDEPELEFYKESNGYEFYLELPYDELCIYSDKVDVKHHGYSYMYKNPNGGSTYSCSSLCGYSREKVVGMLDANIERIEHELLGGEGE